MITVKRLTVSGFRGILAKLSLSLHESAKSVILYGTNATGKSSLTDAWEWLMTGKVRHLSREGAEESAYPHKAAQPGDTYVEVEFSEGMSLG